jgi:hypothetical protein
MPQLSQQFATPYFVFMGSVWSSLQTAITSSNSINQLIFVTMKFYDFFEVRTEFLSTIYTSFGSKGLTVSKSVFYICGICMILAISDYFWNQYWPVDFYNGKVFYLRYRLNS